MAPDTAITAMRAEVASLRRYCTDQVSGMQKQMTAEREACIRRNEEVKTLIGRLIQDSIEQRKLDQEYRKASAALGQKHTKILDKILARVGCGADDE